jgi:hypothetical protein
VSKLLGIIETVDIDEEGDVWLMCQPITQSAPKDIPEIEDIANKYWTGKILARKSNTTKQLTEWFSIPYNNIQKTVGNHLEGPCLIKFTNMNAEEKKEIFSDTKPVFSLNKTKNGKTFRWLNR